MKQPDPDMKIATVFWHFARGMAFAGTGKISDAEAEYKIVSAAEKQTPEDAIFTMPINNKTKDILKIAEDVLGAKIAMAKKDNGSAIAMLQDAVAVQDKLKYNEPQDWFYPVRESLGAAILINGDSAAAEKVFRADLEKNPRNPRSLFGLNQALKAQGRDYDAGFVEKQFNSSWKGTGTLKIEDLV
jgi:Flp pilus assembly protein TadD